MQIWAESGKSALPICNYSQILYQFLTFTQNLKRSLVCITIIIMDATTPVTIPVKTLSNVMITTRFQFSNKLIIPVSYTHLTLPTICSV